MGKRIIIHAGPPKTASTAIQNYYESLNLEKYRAKYIGTFQPRGRKNLEGKNKFSKLVYRYTTKPDESLKKEILLKIDDILNEYDTIVYSEEMLIHGTGWEDKIKNIRELFSAYGVIFLVCHRDAVKSLASYYGQLYSRLPIEMQKNYQNFENSNYSNVYNYEYIHTILINNCKEEDKVIYHEFSDLIENRLDLYELLPIDKFEYLREEKVVLDEKKENYRKKSTLYNEDFIELEVFDDYFRISPQFVRILIMKTNSFGFTKVYSKLRKLLRKYKKIKVYPSDDIRQMEKRNKSFLKQLPHKI